MRTAADVSAIPLLRSRAILRDSASIVIAGAIVGLLANAISPRGLSLGRNYFPAPAPASNSPATAAATDREARFARRGLALVAHARAVELFRDPRFAEGRIVFVDARDDRHFQAGHIPGAIPFDHYRLAEQVATVLAACQLAEHIVVYCNGGNCEDSELAAVDLLELGIDRAKLLVYGGGIAEWQQHSLPLETGSRGH